MDILVMANVGFASLWIEAQAKKITVIPGFL
jgi:hypothetical protein